MEPITLVWKRFLSFVEGRTGYRALPCLYVQTDPHEKVLRVGECDDPWERYKGGSAYALDAAGHGSGNLYFFAAVQGDSALRKRLEATLIYTLQPPYNNQHKRHAPLQAIPYRHEGDVAKGLLVVTSEPLSMRDTDD